MTLTVENQVNAKVEKMPFLRENVYIFLPERPKNDFEQRFKPKWTFTCTRMS
jgi:hypothetical protein